MVRVPPHLEQRAKLLGDMINRARGSMTLTKLAKMTGFSKSTLSRWEKGTQMPTPEQARQLDDVLGLQGHLHAECAKVITTAAVGRPRNQCYAVFESGYVGDAHLLVQAPVGAVLRTVTVSLEYNEAFTFGITLTGLDHVGQALYGAKYQKGPAVIYVSTSVPVSITDAKGHPGIDDDRIHQVRLRAWQRIGQPGRRAVVASPGDRKPPQ